MDIVVPKKDLFKLLDRCHGVADKKSAMPVLANVLLTAEGTALRIAATDLYISMTGETEAEVATSGSIAVPARDLFERVKMMPDGPVQITTTPGSQTTVKAVGQSRRFTVHGLPGSDFPPIPKPAADARAIEIAVDLLSLLMARTHFSMLPDDGRAHLNSTLFECAGGLARMVTTDGHRLSKMEVKLDSPMSATMLIPLKAIHEVRRLTDAAKAEKIATVTMQQSGPNVFFTVAGMTFSAKLVDVQFPPYAQVIPANSAHVVRVPRLALIDVLKAISLASVVRTGGVKLMLTPGALRCTSESPEAGNAFDEVPVDYTGPEMTVGMNAKYVLDVLGAIDDDEVSLGMSGELDPMVITPQDSADGSSYVAVVMPLRT